MAKDMNKDYLSVRIDRKYYETPSGPLEVLRDVLFSVSSGEFLSLVGPSGCGKTTLLRLIAGLDKSFEGQITINGCTAMEIRPDIGFAFQESRLLEWKNVTKNIEFALSNSLKSDERAMLLKKAIELTGLSDSCTVMPYQLSGGMQRRVALARAIVGLPKLLLLDEPFSALDMKSRFILHSEVLRIHRQASLTTVLVTHDLDEAIYLSDRIAILGSVPSTIKKEIHIGIPHPRNKKSPEFQNVQLDVLSNS